MVLISVEHTREWFESNKTAVRTLKAEDKCQNCGNEGEHLHHIVPLVVGGTNNLSNLAVLCAECHGKVHGNKRLLSKELQRKGIESALKKGVKFGRRAAELPENFKEEYDRWKAGEQTAVQTMENLQMKKITFAQSPRK